MIMILKTCNISFKRMKETNLIEEVDDVNIDDDQSGSEFEHIDLDDGDEEYDDEDEDED
ncbi:hypothetical protein R6Q59_025610 [Mikania micrantha]